MILRDLSINRDLSQSHSIYLHLFHLKVTLAVADYLSVIKKQFHLSIFLMIRVNERLLNR